MLRQKWFGRKSQREFRSIIIHKTKSAYIYTNTDKILFQNTNSPKTTEIMHNVPKIKELHAEVFRIMKVQNILHLNL